MWDELKNQWKHGGILVRLLLFNVFVFVALATIRLLERLEVLALTFSPSEVYGLATSWNVSYLMQRPWTIFSHMFVHVGIWHLAMNMLWLYWMGRMFMMRFGARRLLSTYFVGGLVGFLLYVVASNVFPGLRQNSMFAYGASAAVMAIMTAAATANPNHSIRLLLVGAVPLKYLAIGWVVLDYFALSNGSNTGGNVAHLGGAFFGYFMVMEGKRGRDWVGWFERIIDGVVGIWQGGWKAKGTGNAFRKARPNRFGRDTRSGRIKTDEEFNLEKKAKAERMDAILDKISKHGYDNLTSEEKAFLFRQSNK